MIKYGEKLKYKEICECFDDEVKPSNNTNGRKAQFKEWNKKYEVIKNKTFYTIVRERTEEEKQALSCTKEYTVYIENILINLLKHLSDEADNSHVRFSYHELFEKLGITNELYYKILNENKITKEDYSSFVSLINKIDSEIVLFNLDIFFSESQTLLKRMIDDAIKSMEQQMLIVSSKSYRLFKSTILPNGNIVTTQHDCTDEETDQILYIFNKYLKKYRIKKINQVYALSKELRNAYFFEVNKEIKELFKCDCYCKTFDIILTREGINRKYNELLTRGKLNNNVQNKLKTSKVLKKKVAEVLLQVFVDDLVRN